MKVFVLTDSTLRMGCLSTLLRFVDADPEVQVEFVKTLPAQCDHDVVCILKPEAEVLDVGALLKMPTPFLTKGVADLRVTNEGVFKTEDWFLIAISGSQWEMLSDITKLPVRHLPMTTSVDFTFHGDVGQRNLLKIR